MAVAEVTRDFDVERTAQTEKKKAVTFSFGGQKFTLREFVHADVLAEFGRREVHHYGESLDAYDKFVKECIVEEDAAKWDKVRADKKQDPPITVGMVEAVVFWVMDQVVDRPTVTPSSSQRGRGARQGT